MEKVDERRTQAIIACVITLIVFVKVPSPMLNGLTAGLAWMVVYFYYDARKEVKRRKEIADKNI